MRCQESWQHTSVERVSGFSCSFHLLAGQAAWQRRWLRCMSCATVANVWSVTRLLTAHRCDHLSVQVCVLPLNGCLRGFFKCR